MREWGSGFAASVGPCPLAWLIDLNKSAVFFLIFKSIMRTASKQGRSRRNSQVGCLLEGSAHRNCKP